MRVPLSVPTQTPQWLIDARIRAGKPGYPHLRDHHDVIVEGPPPSPDKRRQGWNFQHDPVRWGRGFKGTTAEETIRMAAVAYGWDRRRLKRELRKGGKSRYVFYSANRHGGEL